MHGTTKVVSHPRSKFNDLEGVFYCISAEPYKSLIDYESFLYRPKGFSRLQKPANWTCFLKLENVGTREDLEGVYL